MNKLKKYVGYLGLFFIILNGLPFLMVDTGSGMFIVMILIPILCLLISMVYGVRNGLDLWLLLGIAIVFIPSLYLFYHDIHAWIYGAIYTGMSLVGMILGWLIRWMMLKSKDTI